jgi:hypothetical protein
MTAGELAARIDKNVEWVYVHANDGLIPARRTGSGRGTRWLFPRRRVERWIAELFGDSDTAEPEQKRA